MKNFGILLRGKSLENINLILNNFNNCMIVNNFKIELSKFSKYFKEKNIIHFVNSMKSASLTQDQYKEFNINKIQFSFTKKHRNDLHSLKRINSIINYYKELNLDFNYSPNNLYEQIFNIHNTGVSSILYVSEILQPKNIWIIGLDFYQNDYMIKKNQSHQQKKSNDIDLVGSFLKIINNHQNINYNLISYYKNFPKLKNLNLIRI